MDSTDGMTAYGNLLKTSSPEALKIVIQNFYDPTETCHAPIMGDFVHEVVAGLPIEIAVANWHLRMGGLSPQRYEGKQSVDEYLTSIHPIIDECAALIEAAEDENFIDNLVDDLGKIT